MRIFPAVLLLMVCLNTSFSQTPLKVLNFQGDKGFQHDSKVEALAMIKLLGSKNGWEVITSSDTAIINKDTLPSFDL